MNSIIKYPGSNWSIAGDIISIFPYNYEKATYLEPYFGTGAVFFNKKRSKIETINDINDDIVNLFKVIRDNSKELEAKIEMTPWSRTEYLKAFQESENESNIEKARKFIIRTWQGKCYKSLAESKWSYNLKPVDSGKTGWQNLHSVISFYERMLVKNGNMVQIENRDALELIKEYNKKYVLMYLDPPYIKTVRNRNCLF